MKNNGVYTNNGLSLIFSGPIRIINIVFNIPVNLIN